MACHFQSGMYEISGCLIFIEQSVHPIVFQINIYVITVNTPKHVSI
jgi:hypothetical protein